MLIAGELSMAHTQLSGGDARPADHTQGYMRAGLLLRRCARLYTQQMTAVLYSVLNGFNSLFFGANVTGGLAVAPHC